MEGEKYGEADEHDYKMDLVDKKEDHARDHKNEIARKESVQFDEDEDENEHAELLYNDEMSDDREGDGR
ncbi:hypothetical protein BC829DRAFT_391034 [Chytridium lagenaria]|nr:hypothetical protein BC829DRAFT_391034 [Chytridium lagenaria]